MKSIRAKIMWLLFISVLIASLIIGSVSIFLTSNVIGKHSNENMTLLCKINSDKLDAIFSQIEESINTLADYAQSELSNVETLKNTPARNAYSANLAKNALHHTNNTDGAVAVWFHFDASYIGQTDGFFYIKNESTNEFEPHQLTDIYTYDAKELEHVSWWYNPIQAGKAVWLEAYHDKNINQQIISYAAPIYKGEHLVGIIGVDLSTNYLENITKEISADNSKKIALLTSNGMVVYHPNFEFGKLIGENEPEFESVIEELYKADYTDRLITYKLNGESKRITGYKLRNGMLMTCFASISEIHKEQIHLTIFTIIIIAAVILVALLVAFWISRKLARPIKTLNEAAKHLTDDDFNFEIHSESRDEIGELTSTFIETRNILKHQFDLLNTRAHRDGLTGVGNKSALINRESELNQKISNGTAVFSIAVFDVNKLKITNDIFGHMAGDKLLSTVSNFLLSFFGTQDVYRAGGDEFVVLSEKDDDVFSQLVNDCILSMQNLSVEGFDEFGVSCAHGVAHFNPKTDLQFSDVLRRADKEMYKNKSLTKKEEFEWQKGTKGLKRIQVEKYCQLLQTLKYSTDDYLFLLNNETGVINIFGEDLSCFNVAGDRELTSGISDMLSFVHANDQTLVKDAVSSVLNYDTESINLNFRMQNNDNLQWVNCRGSAIKDENGNSFVVIGRISLNAVKHLYNPITTLYNKTKLNLDLRSKSLNSFSCLMLIDINNLSEINLNHSTEYGDQLLRSLAEELERRFSMWQIYHAEKDRFVVLLDANSSQVVQNIFEEIKESLSGKCSISASVVPNDASLYVSAENIYDYAVQILNNSKKHSIGQIVFFSRDSMLERISDVELLEEFENSVKSGYDGFHLVYQPQINANDFSIISAEALLRFESKTHGLVYPQRFIPLLEQTNLINDVGIWVIDEGLKKCKEWRKFIPDFKISINLSPKQLENKSIAAQITDLLSKHNLPCDALILEITESAQLDKNEDVFTILAKLRHAGIQIAIDDFGTGYSNLGNLKNIQANIIKVDRIFIHDIKENGYHYNLIHNLIEFAKSNSLTVCLEGVENISELVVISRLHADMLQGYLFDKPCSADELERKYFISNAEEYSERLRNNELLIKEKTHAPLINMETKTILQGINVGLWIIRVDTITGESELYTDETMRKLLGVDNNITPKECFVHWHNRVDKAYYSAVDKMINAMANSENVMQVEYPWMHPQHGEITVRCSGRCASKNDEAMIFEGFHRIINGL